MKGDPRERHTGGFVERTGIFFRVVAYLRCGGCTLKDILDSVFFFSSRRPF
jgi:hypothetical protein